VAQLQEAVRLQPDLVDPFYLQALVHTTGQRRVEPNAPFQRALANARVAGRADPITQIESMLRTCRAEATAR
jgi:hypothetical protein